MCNCLCFPHRPEFKSAKNRWWCGLSRQRTQASKDRSWFDLPFCRMFPTQSWTTRLKPTKLASRASRTRDSRKAVWILLRTSTRVQGFRAARRRPRVRPRSWWIAATPGATAESIKSRIIFPVNNRIRAYNSLISTKTSSTLMVRLRTKVCRYRANTRIRFPSLNHNSKSHSSYLARSQEEWNVTGQRTTSRLQRFPKTTIGTFTSRETSR